MEIEIQSLKKKKIKKIIIATIVFTILIALFSFNSWAVGGNVSTNNGIKYLDYEINNVEVNSSNITIYGYAYIQGYQHYTSKAKGSSVSDLKNKVAGSYTHGYYMEVAGKNYMDIGGSRNGINWDTINHTELNYAAGSTKYSYVGIGFCFSIPLNDLGGTNSKTVNFKLHTVLNDGSDASINISYINNGGSVDAGYYTVNYPSISASDYIQPSGNATLVRTAPSKTAAAAKDSAGHNLYFTYSSNYTRSNNTLTGSKSVDANGVTWFQVRYVATGGYDSIGGVKRYRVAPNSSGSYGWLCASFADNSTNPFTLTITKKSYTASFNGNGGFNGTAISKQWGNALGTLPGTSRTGYTFLGWYTAATGGTQISSTTLLPAGGTTYYAHWDAYPTITTPVINNPDKNEILPFVNNGKLIIQLEDTFDAIKYATASDAEDGNITSKLIVKSNGVPLQNGKANKAGTYTVNYQVSDNKGAIASKPLTVIVNDPPKIKVSERYFLKGHDTDIKRLFEKVIASDFEDGDILSLVKVEKIKYSNSDEELNPLKLNTTKEGKFVATLVVTDSYKKHVKVEMIINITKDTIIENQLYTRYAREISLSSVTSLSNKSIWKLDATFSNTLNSVLNKTEPDRSIKYTSSEIDSMKESIKNKKAGEMSNKEFVSRYMR